MVVEGHRGGDVDEYLDVLLLCAAPLNERPLNLAVEVAHLEAEVRDSNIPIRLRWVVPPTLEQLQRELTPAAPLGRAPRVFHFLGHGEEDYLVFEDGEGSSIKVKAVELRRMFKGTPIQFALLNACRSATPRIKSICRHLVEGAGIAAAIGHGEEVDDVSAITFARRFYAEITRGHQPVGKAYFAARNVLVEKGLPDATKIDLIGDRDLQLDEDLAPGERRGRVENRMPDPCDLMHPDFFCGRPKEYRQIARVLADRDMRGFVIWGMGGLGKSALAKEAARRNAWRHPGGVVLVEAREHKIRTARELLRMALSQLDSAARGKDPGYELRNRLSQNPGLIVLNNLDTLRKAEWQKLADFVRQVPRNGSHVLLTARTPMWPIAKVPDVATRLLIDGLDDINGAYYAHRFAKTKGINLLRDDPPRMEAGKVRGLCAQVSRRVSGHPQMIEDAVFEGRWGRAMLEKTLDRLSGELELKSAKTMATGLTLLGDEGHRLLALLPLFPVGNFMPEAMRAACAAIQVVAPARPSPWGRLGSLLERLFYKPRPTELDDETDGDPLAWVNEGRRQLERGGFLERDQQADLDAFHRTLLDHAGRGTGLPPEQYWAGLGGLAGFYLRYLRDSSENSSAVDRCLDNALSVMDRAWEARLEPGPLDALLAELVHELSYVFERRGLWQAGIQWFERTIEMRRVSTWARNDGKLNHERYQLGKLALAQSDYARAKRAFTDCAAYFEEVDNRRDLGATMNQLATIGRFQGNITEARRLAQRSLGLYEHLDDLSGQAAALDQLATIERDQGNLTEARLVLQRCLRLYDRLGDRRGEGHVQHQLAIIERAQGNPAEARRLLQRSLSIATDLDDPHSEAASLHLLAIIESDQGNPAEARRLLQRSSSIFEELGDQQGQAVSLHQLATIERAQGNLAEARRLAESSFALDERLGNLRGQSASLRELAMIESDQRNFPEAKRLLERCLGIDAGLEDLGGQAVSLNELAIIERNQGNSAEARRLTQQSLRLFERLGNLRGQASLLHQLGLIERAQGNPAEARRLWELSIPLNDQVGNVEGRATTLAMLAQLEAVEGNLETSLAEARESVRLLEERGSAKRATARTVLDQVEGLAAGSPSGAPLFLADLQGLEERARAAGPEVGLAVIDAALDEAQQNADPTREVLALLARSAVCWKHGDLAGCDETLRRVEEALDLVGVSQRAALAELLRQIKAQRANATATEPTESSPRREDNMHSVAVNSTTIGQPLVADEARARPRESLEPAKAMGDEELI
jgi:tetratricopeptide (TPR) repeat protein